MSPFCHMDADELERFSTGRASDREFEEFEEHMLTCESCRQRFEESQTYVAAMRAATLAWRREESAKRSWWSLPRLVPVLAGMALLIIGILAINRFTANVPPPVAILLTATRGTVATGTAHAGQALALTPDLTGITQPGPYRLEIVDDRGRSTWKGSYDAARPAQVPAHDAGTYFVRVYSGSGDLLREYGLDILR